MKFTTNILKSLLVTLFALTLTVGNAQTDAKSQELLNNLTSVVGNYDKLKSKKDVQFHYVYDNFDAGKDISAERLIFDGEHSWATYGQHDRNVLPGKKGVAQQSLIHGVPQLTLNGKFIADKEALGATVFIREVNSFWFSMIYKLGDNGTNHTYMGTENVDGINYEKVSLTYDNAVTGKPADDEYILYFNPKTHMLDLFYFSLPAFGVNDPILKMTMDYEKIDGVYIPTVRKSYAPNPETGEYGLNGEYTFSNIKFKNKYKPADFKLIGM